MSLEDLQADLKSNTSEAQRLLVADPENPLLRHLVNTVWPFQDAILAEMSEQADALDEVVDQAGDMLQAETAGIFAAAILASNKLCDELERKLSVADLELRGLIKQTRDLNQEAAEVLEEITVPPTDEEEETDDDDDDDDDDDGDDDKEHASDHSAR